MDPLFQDERISAYLDGELPADERSQFEDELARNGELRQVVEELRGLHDSLQALPRHRLNDDFSQQVLRRAERVMLSDSHASANGANEASGISVSRAHKSRRPWIWAAVAIAAAVMLMVLNPPPKKDVKIAQMDAVPRANAAGQEKPGGLLPEGRLSAPGGGSVAKRDPSLLAKEGRPSDLAHEREQTHIGSGTLEANEAPQAAPAPAAVFGRRDAEKFAASAANSTTNSATAQAGTFTGSPAGAASGFGSTPPGDVQFRQNGVAPLADSPSRGPSLKARSFAFVRGQHAMASSPAGGMIVAEYATTAKVSPAALQRLLDKRGITLNESPAANLALLSAVRSASPAEALKLADADRAAQAAAADDEPLEVVYVVGTRAQVMGLVDDLHSQPAQYRTLSVAAVTPEAAEGRENDSKASEKLAAAVPQAIAPAAPLPAPTAPSTPSALAQDAKLDKAGEPEPAVAADGIAGGAVAPHDLKKETAKQGMAKKPGAGEALAGGRNAAERKAVEPAAPSAVAAAASPAADSEAAAAATEQANGSGWATQMMSLPPETESVLRQSLAERENQPASHLRQLDLQKSQVAAKGSAESNRDKDSDDQKDQKSVGQSSQGASKRDELTQLDSGAAGDQVQAVLVFRLAPSKASSPAKVPK